jgi:hypothetical protein
MNDEAFTPKSFEAENNIAFAGRLKNAVNEPLGLAAKRHLMTGR